MYGDPLMMTRLLAAADANPQAGAKVLTVWDSLRQFRNGFITHLPNLTIGLVVLVLTWAVAAGVFRLANRLLAHTKLRRSLRDLCSKLLYSVLWVMGIIASCMVVFPTLTPGRLMATLGLSSIAIGFAFKDIFENFFAGVLILWRFPFEIDDFIECEGIVGRVEDIWIRMTLIRQVDGQLVLVPNAMIFKNATTVITSQKQRRQTVICGIAYSEDVAQARGVIREAVEGCTTIKSSKPVEIFAQAFADSSVNFEVTWWCGSTPLEARQSRDEVVEAVKKALDDAGIEIPFPYRTLTFNDPVEMISSHKNDEASAS